MAYWMTHLRVAEALLRLLPQDISLPTIMPAPSPRTAAAPSTMKTARPAIFPAVW